MEISAIKPHHMNSPLRIIGQKQNVSNFSNQSNISETRIQKLSSQYNVRNMSAPEMKQLGQELYDNGSIGLTELGILTLVPIESVNTDNGMVLRSLSANPSSNEKFDYIRDIKGALDFAKKQGEKGHEFLEATLSVLKMLDTTKKGPINIVA